MKKHWIKIAVGSMPISSGEYLFITTAGHYDTIRYYTTDPISYYSRSHTHWCNLPPKPAVHS